MRNPILPTAIAAGVLLLVSAFGAFAQQQSAGQQACLNKLNKDGSAVAKVEGKIVVGCVKSAGGGKLVGTAQDCLTEDPKGKLQNVKNATVAAETSLCGTPPDFGYTSAVTIDDAAVQGKLDLTADIYGANLDPAVISCATNKAGCRCQQTVSKVVEKLAATKLAIFVKCKKAALHDGATSAAGLSTCVDDASTVGSIAADTKGVIQKTLTGLNAGIVKACDMPGVTSGAFPGTCTGTSGGALGSCLDVQVECRVCQTINRFDGLFVDCDLFDDQIANASCTTGVGPAPTPTPTVTPTPTATATFVPGVVLQGALTATNGRFNYNLMLGLAGANSACNTHFPGTHACAYSELQSAEAAGDLDGLKDIGNNTVTGFWAIDSGQPALQQCNDDALGGSGLNWEYATAHTASRGQKVALNNATGALGVLQSSLQCNISGTSWVGCCL
ncbi:MAG: hypothetical protein HY271_11985 [Deltaproteobacteria bacterium]|nr:hypothetical protein [Deltaproteobacteria bacterium]